MAVVLRDLGRGEHLSRITVEGSYYVDEWVKVNVVAGSSVLKVHRVAYR